MTPFRITYITGTRADFGLMRSTLLLIGAAPELDLSVIVTGMHLDDRYGATVREVEASRLRIAGRVAVTQGETSGATMSRHLGEMVLGFTDILEAERPSLVLLLGDRGEMLAGAIAAIHLDIPVAHIAGGDRSGTVDEPVRHAISKLSHIHFASTAGSAERLIRMGERADHVFAVGTPSLDEIIGRPPPDADELRNRFGVASSRPLILLIFHPVLQSAANSGDEVAEVLAGLDAVDADVLAILPNSDAGSEAIRATLLARARRPGWGVLPHVARDDYLDLLAVADVLVGNSSSGIVEAASFGTPVVNIGNRQAYRERNANTVDVLCERGVIADAIGTAFGNGRLLPNNVYGDGKSGARIRDILVSRPWGQDVTAKFNAY